jgi:tetratricopeptide (TPR) repeat protein
MDEQEQQKITADEFLHKGIIHSADEFHEVAEEQWEQAIELQPESDEAIFEFRRLVRAALQFYSRAYLALALVETDDEQQLEEFLEIISEQDGDLAEFFRQNDAEAILDEESHSNISQVFSIAEAIRTALLEQSTQLAATLPFRFARDSEAT